MRRRQRQRPVDLEPDGQTMRQTLKTHWKRKLLTERNGYKNSEEKEIKHTKKENRTDMIARLINGQRENSEMFIKKILT